MKKLKLAWAYTRLFLTAKDIISIFKAALIKLEDELWVDLCGFKRRIGKKKLGWGNFSISFTLDNSTLTMYNEIFCLKVYSLFSEFLPKQGDTVVDLGACQGIYTLFVAQNNTKGKIYAVEPDPDNFEWLVQHLRKNNTKNVICINEAVVNRNGSVYFQKGATSGSGRIIDNNVSINSDKRIIEVKATTLDNIFEKFNMKRIHILKIDVEGAEVDVLIGGKKALKKTEKIVLECHSDELREKVKKLLFDRGFKEITHKNKFLPNILYFINRK